jgi:hypothetical protein
MKAVERITDEDVVRVKDSEWPEKLGALMSDQSRCIRTGKDKKGDWEDYCASKNWKF